MAATALVSPSSKSARPMRTRCSSARPEIGGQRRVIDIRVRRLSLGNPGDAKPVGEGASELRIDYGPGHRVDFVQRADVLIVLLVGGDKRTQDQDIPLAKQLARELRA
jgi:putative addiction module killer protein